MKKVISIILSLVMIVCSVICVDLSSYAVGTTDKEIIDIDVYKAKCISGIAEDPSTDSVRKCNSFYNFYVNDEIYSPSQSFLDTCYQDQDLMNKYNAFMAYSTISDPGSVLDMPKEKEDYYKTIIVSSLRQTLTNEAYGIEKFIKDKTLNNSVSVLDSLCNDFNVATIADLAEKFDLNSSADVELFTENFGKYTTTYYGSAIATKATGVIGKVIGCSADIIDLSDRISSYVSMLDLDVQASLWLNQMLACCDSNTDPLMITALKSLINYGTGFADAFLEKINEVGYTVINWSVDAVIDVGFATLAGSNPVLLAAVAGLKAGKALSNLFFAGDSVASQLFTMQCIFNVEDLARNVAEACKNNFISSQTSENARVFNYAVDQYFEILINVDTDCMEAFLDTLYNGGILSGAIKWAYGVTNDYQDCINALEGLRSTRKDNYNNMILYYKGALGFYDPDTYKLYYPSKDQIDIEGIDFDICKIKPPGYPLDDGVDLYEGEFCDAGVYFTPSNTTQRNYTLTSSNTDVLEIKDNCMFSAKSAGVSTVTITSIDNPRISYTEDVVVGKPIDGAEDNKDLGVNTGLTYIIDESSKTVTITGLVEGYAPKSLKIPSKIQGYPVTTIGDNAFIGCGSLISVTIPDSVTTICHHAFCRCSLTSVTIPDSVTIIGDNAFRNCDSLTSVTISDSVISFGGCAFTECESLTNVTIGNSVTTIGSYAFSQCNSLKSIEIPDSVTTIGYGAFENCFDLTSVTIGNSVTIIGDYAFDSCLNLTNFIVDSNNPNYSSQDGVLFNKDKTVLIQHPSGNARTSYTIPNSVTTIGDNAFIGCGSLISVTIPDSVTTIGDNAFIGCGSLISVTIPDSVTTIGEGAFSCCSNLTSVTIPDSVTTIGSCAFRNCTDLTSVTIGNGVTIIEYSAFYDCDSLTNITIPDSVTTIGSYAFRNCTSLTSVTIGNGVTIIEDGAFGYCYDLTSVTIGNGVTIIEDGAFGYCYDLTEVYYSGTIAQWNEISIGSSNEDLIYATIHFTDGIINCVHDFGDNAPNCLICGIANPDYVAPTEPTTKPAETTTKPSTKPVETTKPAGTTKPTTQPTTKPTQATTQPTQATTKPAGTTKPTTQTTKPTEQPTNPQTTKPVTEPTTKPVTEAPTEKPTEVPTELPTETPTEAPTEVPTEVPTTQPIEQTTNAPDPTQKPTVSVTQSSTTAPATTQNTTATTATVIEKETTTAKEKPPVKGVQKVSGEWVDKKQKNASVKKLKKAKKSLKVYWKKVSGVKGYQIQYSTDKKFKKNTKKVTVKGNKATSKTIKKLKGGKKYYVRVRTYKTYKVNKKSINVYSKWSKVKAVTVKK